MFLILSFLGRSSLFLQVLDLAKLQIGQNTRAGIKWPNLHHLRERCAKKLKILILLDKKTVP